jgi:hypothetical protein
MLTDPGPHTMKWTCILTLLTLFLAGCGTSYIPLTDATRDATTLSTAVFHSSTELILRSVRPLAPVDTTTTPFRKDGHRYLIVAPSAPGHLRTQGPGWLIIDFGQDIFLRFDRAATGEYVMPGWGTVTVGDQRYDLQLGMLSGTDIKLLIEPLHPS